MYFPKLETIKTHKKMNSFIVNKFDEWLASQSEFYTDYLNPLSFISECGINKKLGLLVFALSASNQIFKEDSPLLKIKYVIDCPTCLNNNGTYYNRTDIPNDLIECFEEDCRFFNPSHHPERINIYFELLDYPKIETDDILQIYEKVPVPPFTNADEDIDIILWSIEEQKGL
jgi:hypothetical protein